jgi:hypothetical protein
VKQTAGCQNPDCDAHTFYSTDQLLVVCLRADGRQFMVDAGTGLANVPDKYRKEVSAQLEIIQRIAAAARTIKH